MLLGWILSDEESSHSQSKDMRNADQTNLIIEAGHAEKQYWKDLWLYRELFYFLAWRDILVRYKQTGTYSPLFDNGCIYDRVWGDR
jgi:hypothetical protein